jgi:DnaK suppressor protein
MGQKRLTDHELEQARKRLMLRKSELEEQLAELASESVSDDSVQDTGDQALSSVMETLRSSLQDSEYREYVRIVQALKAIEAGTYGVCADCGEPISEKRLKHNPNAVRCIVCQETYESAERIQ